MAWAAGHSGSKQRKAQGSGAENWGAPRVLERDRGALGWLFRNYIYCTWSIFLVYSFYFKENFWIFKPSEIVEKKPATWIG